MKPTFVTLIRVYQIEGMIALGKMLHPITNTMEKNLDHARYVIDILDVIKEKTQSNLNEEEGKFLDSTISMLKLNFVDESNRVTDDSGRGNT